MNNDQLCKYLECEGLEKEDLQKIKGKGIVCVEIPGYPPSNSINRENENLGNSITFSVPAPEMLAKCWRNHSVLTIAQTFSFPFS